MKLREIAHARAGNGPAGVFCEMGRFHGHFVGDPEGYRGPGEVKRLRQDFCCLKKFRARMEQTGELAVAELDDIDAAVNVLIDEAVLAARAARRPVAAEVATDVYVNY